MKALILNSGMGTRMGVLTKEHPKCMTDIAEDESILSAQLKKLYAFGVTDVVITTGYFDRVLVEYCSTLGLPLNYEFVYNPRYSETNYIYSIYCAREILKGNDILLMHGDLVFEEEALARVLAFQGSCMTVSTTLPLPEKDFKAVLADGKITAVGIDFFENAVAAQPLYKLLAKDWDTWLDRISAFCENGTVKCYAENALNEVSGEMNLRPLDVLDLVCNEVDNAEDLAAVSARYQKTR